MIPPALKKLAPDIVIRAYENELRKETHINRALKRFGENTLYVEIGVRDGECIRQIRAQSRYAVDPAPLEPAGPNWNGVRLFPVTSDEFFDRHAGEAIGRKRVHVALADGLHEFRQTLRDVLNLERYMHAAGTVFIHDCNPPTRAHAENRNGPWNGDVWKVAYYLQEFRPDLSYVTLDCDWGLGVVSGFSTNPPVPDSETVASVASLDYEFLEKNRKRVLNLKSPLVGRMRR